MTAADLRLSHRQNTALNDEPGESEASKSLGKRRKTPSKDVLRNDQVIRVLNVLRDLGRLGGCDLYELAERYGTDTRTIRRDLTALCDAGIPVVSERAPDSSRVRWRVDARVVEHVLKLLDASHYLALRLAMAESKAVRNSGSLFAMIEDLSERIETAVGAKGRAQLAAVENCFASWEKFAWRKAPPDLMRSLVVAISERSLVSVTYRAPSSGNRLKTFTVLPLKLFVHAGDVYLHAWREERQTLLVLNVQRLSALETLGEKGTAPADYDPEALEQSAFGVFIGGPQETFRLRFDSVAAPYVEERCWHPSQKLERLPDGAVELTFTCTASYEVTTWVAGWQGHVEVLEPKRLRDEFRDHARWLAKKYQ
jgi:predicted DNA-binding transcriptional regulator YafY